MADLDAEFALFQAEIAATEAEVQEAQQHNVWADASSFQLLLHVYTAQDAHIGGRPSPPTSGPPMVRNFAHQPHPQHTLRQGKQPPPPRPPMTGTCHSSL